jgi:hypothetical protein
MNKFWPETDGRSGRDDHIARVFGYTFSVRSQSTKSEFFMLVGPLYSCNITAYLRDNDTADTIDLVRLLPSYYRKIYLRSTYVDSSDLNWYTFPTQHSWDHSWRSVSGGLIITHSRIADDILSQRNVQIDHRGTVRLSDYATHHLYPAFHPEDFDDNQRYLSLECRKKRKASMEDDIYSFAMTAYGVSVSIH